MGYALVGILWCLWLEWFTTTKLDLEWTFKERIFHTGLWPISLSIFIVNLFNPND